MTDPTRRAIADARQALALVEDAYREHLAQLAAEAAGLADTSTALASIHANVEGISAQRDRAVAALDRVRAECDAIDSDMHAVRDVTARIRAAIEESTR